MDNPSKSEPGVKISVALVEIRRTLATNAIIEQWAATWTKFLQREAYPQRAVTNSTDAREHAAS